MLELEKKEGKLILHRHTKDDDANKKLLLTTNQKKQRTPSGWTSNPFVGFADYAQFIIHKDSVEPDLVFNLFASHAKEITPELTYYHNSVCYETDNPVGNMDYWQQFAFGAISLTIKDNPKMIYGTEKEEDRQM